VLVLGDAGPEVRFVSGSPVKGSTRACSRPAAVAEPSRQCPAGQVPPIAGRGYFSTPVSCGTQHCFVMAAKPEAVGWISLPQERFDFSVPRESITRKFGLADA
jgi:hypothetical protein